MVSEMISKHHTHSQHMAFTLETGGIHTIRELINRDRVSSGKRVDGFVLYHIEMVACAVSGIYATLRIDGRVLAETAYSSPMSLMEPFPLEGDEQITVAAVPGVDIPIMVFSGTCFWNWPGTKR
ncbi:hypothetical protein LCGC14_2128460 [marine sediment metagenome]|uniref:Uncharacterized protein n=1 Tax=marine sediment metagenome TaxID=412755 RepID=A0A0F9E266_9ZZZZ